MMEKLKFGKYTENLVEIALMYAEISEEHEKLKETDNIVWSQQFVEWANEFENLYGEVEDFDVELGRSYYEMIREFAKEKILEFGGVTE